MLQFLGCESVSVRVPKLSYENWILDSQYGAAFLQWSFKVLQSKALLIFPVAHNANTKTSLHFSFVGFAIVIFF